MSNYDESRETLIPITQLADDLGYKPKRTDFNPDSFIITQFIPLKKLYVDKEYQRLLKEAMIRNQSEYDPTLASDIDVFLRPNGKYSTADGQHGAVIGYLYTIQGGELAVPCKVRRHPEYYTIEQCLAAESKFFLEKNKNRTQVSQLEKLRSAICYQDAEALETLDKLISMGVCLEKIGAEDGIEVHGLSKILEAYSVGLTETKQAIALYKAWIDDTNLPKWKEGKLKASFIGGLARTFMLIKTLGKGDMSNALSNYVTNNLKKSSVKTLTEGTAGTSQSHAIACRIVNRLNTLIEEGYIYKKDGKLLSKQISESMLATAGIVDPTA